MHSCWTRTVHVRRVARDQKPCSNSYASTSYLHLHSSSYTSCTFIQGNGNERPKMKRDLGNHPNNVSTSLALQSHTARATPTLNTQQ